MLIGGQGNDEESPNFKKIVIQHHRQKHLEMNVNRSY
jgi:hypothetical protein